MEHRVVSDHNIRGSIGVGIVEPGSDGGGARIQARGPIKVSVAKGDDGAVIGYKIRPGRNQKEFTDFGFQSDDIVTAINGVELNNPTKALEVYRMLREAKDATFSVKRGDEDLTLIVGLDAQKQ